MTFHFQDKINSRISGCNFLVVRLASLQPAEQARIDCADAVTLKVDAQCQESTNRKWQQESEMTRAAVLVWLLAINI